MDVIKANGKREKFNETKLKKSVKKAMVDAGKQVNKNAVEKVVKEVKKKKRESKDNRISTAEIRNIVVRKLSNVSPKTKLAWQRFERKYKRRRPQTRRRAAARTGTARKRITARSRRLI
ncbi:hypothetical protein GF327_06095 [Candidatus Woesearchaeota archaeon]|nr:hypothetical protein [Candidatus Woesearchaeota archaeon]